MSRTVPGFVAGTMAIGIIVSACTSGADRPRSALASSRAPTSSPATGVPSGGLIPYLTTPRDTPSRADQWDLWLYDIAHDRRTRLTTDGQRSTETDPRMLGDEVTFVLNRNSLVLLDPKTLKRKTILTADNQILAYEWSPNHKEVAYIAVNFERDSVHRLRVLSLVTGKTRTLRKLGVPPGRGTGDYDAVAVTWNRAGDRLLVNDTHLDGLATIRILSARTGRDLIPGIHDGANALWSRDNRSIYFLRIPSGWRRMDLRDGSQHPLHLDPTTVRASLSPDGRRIAGTSVTNRSSTFPLYRLNLLDLVTGTQKIIATGYREPVWLTSETFAALRVSRCQTNNEDCQYYGWRGDGVFRFDLSGSTRQLALGTTSWDALGALAAAARPD